ncbi:hypothetical protein PSPO01_12249 [Paraphaeosphaeria sporulosa]
MACCIRLQGASFPVHYGIQKAYHLVLRNVALMVPVLANQTRRSFDQWEGGINNVGPPPTSIDVLRFSLRSHHKSFERFPPSKALSEAAPRVLCTW